MWWKIAVAVGVIAVGYQIKEQQLLVTNQENPGITFRNGQVYPTVPSPVVLTNEEIFSFQRDGFLLKKGVISGKDLDALTRAGHELYNIKTWKDRLFGSSIFYSKLSTQIWRSNSIFAQAAFESDMVSISAALMQATQRGAGENDQEFKMRMLKDGFFVLAGNKKNTGCSFHCDDKFFWPTADDTSGVNVWLTLSPISAAQGGGIRVVNQSLSREFHSECMEVIRNDTCSMEKTNPICFDKMMKASVVYDMEPGDALFWDRWTFHRGEPFVEPTDDHKLRYTVRYVPSTATAQGYVHPSIEQGKFLSGPYYPQVWPTFIQEEVAAFRVGLEDDFAPSPLLVAKIVLRKLGFITRLSL